MTPDDIDLHAWHADGHTIDLFMDVFVGGTRNHGQLAGRITCPPDSVCRRWYEAHKAVEFHCFLQMELEAVGLYDLLDGSMDAKDLPSDWSSDFPITVEWRDEGEDGVYWRPVVATTEGEKGDGHTG